MCTNGIKTCDFGVITANSAEYFHKNLIFFTFSFPWCLGNLFTFVHKSASISSISSSSSACINSRINMCRYQVQKNNNTACSKTAYNEFAVWTWDKDRNLNILTGSWRRRNGSCYCPNYPLPHNWKREKRREASMLRTEPNNMSKPVDSKSLK